MVSREPVLLIVAADRRELAGFPEARRVDLGLRWSAECELDGGRALLVAHGPGQANAREATARTFAKLEVRAVASAGFVGGLDPALRVGDIFVARAVRQAEATVEYPVELPEADGGIEYSRGVLWTSDRVAQTVEEKRSLRALGADAVDMEAVAVAAEAAGRGVCCYCVRVVSDDARTDFALDFNRARRADGTFSGWSIAAQAAWPPGRWKELLQLKRTADDAARRLALFLRSCRFPPKQN